jgi:hypothetical protein
MKLLQFEVGGRPRANDDLQTLQGEFLDATTAPYLGYGPFVLSGCAVSGTTNGQYIISSGIVFLDGQLLRFYSQSNATLPAQFQAGAPVQSDPRPYQTGNTRFCMAEVRAELVPTGTASAGEVLAVETWGAKTWAHVRAAQFRSLHQIEWLAAFTPAHYEATTGRGLPGTEAWGWQLCNGQGAVNMEGRFPVGYQPGSADYQPGQGGGLAQVTLGLDHMPPHNHTGGQPTARFAVVDGLRTANLDSGDYDNTPTEPNLNLALPVQTQGGGQPFDNRPPYRALVCRQWVGY